jgi:hypothetical protein
MISCAVFTCLFASHGNGNCQYQPFSEGDWQVGDWEQRNEMEDEDSIEKTVLVSILYVDYLKQSIQLHSF